MATTNIFMNSYQQPENKLTYNFLCLLEHMDCIKEFGEYLLDNKILLSDSSVEGIETVFSGGTSNPDGKVCFKGQHGQEYNIFIENKTWRYGLSKKQIEGHLIEHCKSENAYLLVITPRNTDKRIMNEIKSDKVFFKTWSNIADKLKEINQSLPNPSFLISQFIEYGELSGEFKDMENITKEEIGFYINTIKFGTENKMNHLFQRITTDFDIEKYGFKNIQSTIKKHWGRFGIEFGFDRKTDYGQWFFFGILFHPADHQIKFKKEGTPELVFIFDCKPAQKDILQQNGEFKNAIENLCKETLCKESFEQNLTKKVANSWRLLLWRKPLSEIDDFSFNALKNILENILATLCKEKAFIDQML